MRNALARVLIALATLAGTLAFTAYLLLATTLNPHRVGDVAASLLDDPAGRRAVTQAVVSGIQHSTGVTLSPTQEQQMNRLLGRDDVRRALGKTRLTPDGQLDYQPLLRSVASRLRAAGQPEAAAAVAGAGQHRITVPNALFDRYTKARHLARAVLWDAGIMAGILAVAGFLVAASKRWALRRIGWGILGTVAGAIILYLVIPRVAAHIIGDNIGTALLTAFGADLVAPLVTVALVGVIVIAISYVPLGRSRSTTSPYGAADRY